MIARKMKTYLEAIPAIQDRLSEPKWGVRIRVGTIPQGMPLPYVRLAEIGGAPDYHLRGEIGDLAETVQVDVWAESEQEADEIAELVRGYNPDGSLVATLPLSGYRGGTWDGTVVQAVTITSQVGTFEDPRDGSDTTRFRNTRNYQIHYERPAAIS